MTEGTTAQLRERIAAVIRSRDAENYGRSLGATMLANSLMPIVEAAIEAKCPACGEPDLKLTHRHRGERVAQALTDVRVDAHPTTEIPPTGDQVLVGDSVMHEPEHDCDDWIGDDGFCRVCGKSG